MMASTQRHPVSVILGQKVLDPVIFKFDVSITLNTMDPGNQTLNSLTE
jgi:hypothetical protein